MKIILLLIVLAQLSHQYIDTCGNTGESYGRYSAPTMELIRENTNCTDEYMFDTDYQYDYSSQKKYCQITQNPERFNMQTSLYYQFEKGCDCHTSFAPKNIAYIKIIQPAYKTGAIDYTWLLQECQVELFSYRSLPNMIGDIITVEFEPHSEEPLINPFLLWIIVFIVIFACAAFWICFLIVKLCIWGYRKITQSNNSPSQQPKIGFQQQFIQMENTQL